MPVETELYDTLGVAPDATIGEIKKAYRKLALIHHPDKGGDENTFKKITAAYEMLKDDEKRKMYDNFGKDGLRGASGISPDIFAHLFNNSPFGGIFNMFNQMRNATRREKPVIFQREVTLEELCKRKVLSIKVTRNRVCNCQQNAAGDRKCENCQGTGRIREQRVIGPGLIQQTERVCEICRGRGVTAESCGDCNQGVIQSPKIFHVHLTPDMPNGYQYKFSGDGNESPGVLPGDFIVLITHKPHEQFGVHEKHLIYKRKTTLKEALCGYDALVIHPTGENIALIVRGVISPGEQRVIKGKGLGVMGDLYVEHHIVFPRSLTKKQTTILAKILN